MKPMILYKYQGAGNDFLIADNRDGGISLSSRDITFLCDRHYGIGADGLMLLEDSGMYDFRMVYFNSDGSGGMMCGNGGRCIVAFAADMGIRHFDFEAADGFHTAEILENEGNTKTVRLKMKNVSTVKQENGDSWFIDTGTRHHVRLVKALDSYDVTAEGRKTRYMAKYGPAGVNANFAEILPQEKLLHVRTYEKGVEAETCACGTGITASAIAAWLASPDIWPADGQGNVHIPVKALNDMLAVDFTPSADMGFTDVWLTGPAVKVAVINV